jgi:hypothetical protein
VNDEWEMIWGKNVVAYLRVFSDIYVERLRKTKKTLSRYREFPGLDLNPGPLKQTALEHDVRYIIHKKMNLWGSSDSKKKR